MLIEACGGDPIYIIPPEEGCDCGSSNIVEGDFVTESEKGVHTLSIPYTGNGYPVAGLVYLADGYNSPSDTDWYGVILTRAIGAAGFVKDDATTAPTYSASGEEPENLASWWVEYKSNSSDGTKFLGTAKTMSQFYSSVAPDATSISAIINMSDNTTLNYYVRENVSSASNGFVGDKKYHYVIVYSE